MPFLPWRSFRSWSCQACGECCAKFNVYLSWSEAVFLTQEYGSNVIEKRNGRIILKRVGRRCVFQDGKLCSIQEHKPLACKVWPFKITEHPVKLEDRKLAEYNLWGRSFYVYLNTFCRGINKGAPIWITIPEAIALHLNLTKKQTLTTSQKLQEWSQENIRKLETPLLIPRRLPQIGSEFILQTSRFQPVPTFSTQYPTIRFTTLETVPKVQKLAFPTIEEQKVKNSEPNNCSKISSFSNS
ncbi:MAG: YkgJ family cysteine cluster protein [Candidatus Freyarchaeota archaeon]|nr:YkgJ family cysteine cluster protein [Candidatus Freyarchaeota archaeon]